MNLHQVLTGATNDEDRCYAVGSVEGKHFTAYAAGFNIVILDGNFCRVQIISGTEHGHISEITCISCCSDIGKIAASYQSKIVIYEPAPVVRFESNKILSYQWYQTGSLQLSENVLCLNWNLEGSCLLTSCGNLLQMWQGTETLDDNQDFIEENSKVDFVLGGDLDEALTEMYEWTCIWETILANPATTIKFSSDGTLFATVSNNDRLVKIWYENIRLNQSNSTLDNKIPLLNFSFFYLCHPRAVTEISWRRTSKYMQRGVIANILMTSCKDGICRIWRETFLPEDGMFDCRLSEVNTSSKQSMHNKRRIIQRLSHIRRILRRRKRRSNDQLPSAQLQQNKDTFSNDFHKYGHMNNLNLTLHFHLSASIDFGADIPTINSFVNGCKATNFVTHWLNNKEFQATFEAERILDEMNLRNVTSSKTTPKNLLSPTESNNGGLIMVGSENALNDKFCKDFKENKLLKAKTSSNFESEKNSPSENDILNTDFKDIEVDPTEHQMDQLIRDWNESVDILFSIHPIDGSLLIWTVHYLDESSPGTFRQAQICFNSKLPGAFPICDAATMTPNIWLYCDYGRINFKNFMQTGTKNKSDIESFKQEKKDYLTTPHIVLLSKHTNGSLNLWHMHFTEGSNFSNTTIVTHVARACGHRFHANGATCHPVLPLLLTTSHLRLATNIKNSFDKDLSLNIAGSELILWRVVPISPLSYSGGISELARINSNAKLAFENVAWIPTILPVNSLDMYNNSPSALFVASNGQMLRIYHAILDARSLLNNVKVKTQRLSNEDEEIIDNPEDEFKIESHLNIISDQSTSRPGCIIDLMPIKDANQAWNKIKLIHIFQERMIKKDKPINGRGNCEAFIDLQNASIFNERFYLVVMEIREKKRCIMHMWCITISSTNNEGEVRIDPENLISPFVHINTEKICEEPLPLPSDIKVLSAVVAAGHLSSSSIYPACYAPYILSTACSDGQVYFWKCELQEMLGSWKANWSEWKMMVSPEDSSTIPIIGNVLSISCAYNGLVAIAYNLNFSSQIFDSTKTLDAQQFNEQFKNIRVAVYECSSTGGSQWVLEDTISLGKFDMPHLKFDLDPKVLMNFEEDTVLSPLHSQSRHNVPSPAMVHSLKKVKSICGNKENKVNILKTSRPFVHLDWVSTEDGSHVLTVGVGPRILLYVGVSGETATALTKDIQSLPIQRSLRMNRSPLQKTKSMAVMKRSDNEVRWIQLRSVELNTADGLAPFPVHVSWVRNGMLVVGMDNEMHVYSQWQPSYMPMDNRDSNKDNAEIINPILTNIKNVSRVVSRSSSLSKLDATTNKDTVDGKSDIAQSIIASIASAEGLFEGARLANPVLPQYHPKQLIELLNFGKIRRVRAILHHLLRCITSGLTTIKQPVISISEGGQLPSDDMDYFEISSIPPLPLYALLDADSDKYLSEKSNWKGENSESEYNKIFSLEAKLDNQNEDPFIDLDPDASAAKEQQKKTAAAAAASDISQPGVFGPQQAKIFARHLTHIQLPGISGLDQMYLLALAETVANTDAKDTSSSLSERTNVGENQRNIPDAIDECGLRFLLAARHHTYLSNTLPLRQRAALQKRGLNSADYIWAFHSDSQEELLNSLPCMQKANPTWSDLKQFGAGWWIRNINVLMRCFEKLAKSAFQSNKDPLDAALFYLAMKKKSILWGLFRSVDDAKMAQFFKNDFKEERWKKAALKNAFALLGKQKFYCAAAFFLLSGNINDAIEVCLRKLEDIQLALIIARLYDNEVNQESVSQTYLKLIRDHIEDPNIAINDPFILSMMHWILQDYNRSLSSLIENDPESDGLSAADDLVYTAKSSVFNFYNYLRTHPYVVRQRSTNKSDQANNLGGFNYSNKALKHDNQYIDQITPIERRLYFTTANEHFKNGCPALALEVLAKLPPSTILTSDRPSVEDSFDKQSDVGAVTNPFLTNTKEIINSVDVKADLFDWSQPVFEMDDSPLKLDFGFDNEESNEDKSEEAIINKNVETTVEQNEKAIKFVGNLVNDREAGLQSNDIMAQQLKFISCLKIIVDELSTLATGFEVDGGQLRYQLYYWLEKEVEVLKQLCNYVSESLPTNSQEDLTGFQNDGSVAVDTFLPNNFSTEYGSSVSEISSSPYTYNEQENFQNDMSDMIGKQRRMVRRRHWLQANHQLLATLLSFSIMHGSSGGGLTSVRMELLLLLQELQEDPPISLMNSLLSSSKRRHSSIAMPYCNIMPLVAASLSSLRSVVADPIQYLTNMCHDLLNAILDFDTAPSSETFITRVQILRNLGSGLSACMYQSLSDCDSFVVQLESLGGGLMEGFACPPAVLYKDSHLMAGVQGRKRRDSILSISDVPKSEPNVWPGISALISLMKKRQDSDTPVLRILLMETLVAVYFSQLCHALATYDSIVLYRLVARPLIKECWGVLFGGGIKQLVKNVAGIESGSKQQIKLVGKVMGQQVINQRFNETRQPIYEEKYIPPQMSILNYFMTKISTAEHPDVDFDSTESISSADEAEDVDEDTTTTFTSNERGRSEHSNTNSYSWHLMRYAIIKYVLHTLSTFLPSIGCDLHDLAQYSPLVHSLLKNLTMWENYLKNYITSLTLPDDYIPTIFVDMATSSYITLDKYASIFKPDNTPFITKHHSAKPIKRLWNYLVTREYLHGVFIKYIFKTNPPKALVQNENMKKKRSEQEAMKIIHKDQEIISSFAINQVNINTMALATQKEIIEIDINGILQHPVWIQHDIEYDIENIKNPSTHGDRPEDLLVVRSPYDQNLLNGAILQSETTVKGGNIPSTVLLKRPDAGVRKLASHPSLPFYVSGAEDGCVKLWEWGQPKVVNEIRKPGAFPKVTKVLFNSQGNKIGITDVEGNLNLWQVGSGINMSKPFLNMKCHSKMTSDFVFVGSSSLLATAGHSSDNKNVCMWDTLLPQKKMLVQAFQCHPDGCSVLSYAPQHQILLTSGKKGEICIFDTRQRQLRHTFQAHNSAIKCIYIDPNEDVFVTGSADGDIKLWNLSVHNLIEAFPNEHIKTGSTIFRNTSSGVIQVFVDLHGNLISCGNDGTLKVRQIFDKPDSKKKNLMHSWCKYPSAFKG